MALTYGDVLAGPILRRVDRHTAAVWLALARPATVTLKVWEGAQVGDTVAAPLASASVATRRVGAGLHLALAVITRADDAPLKSDQLYSYDVELSAEGEGSGRGLLKLGLLGVAGEDGTKGPLALGYAERKLPTFALPPSDITRLSLLAGSCRLPISPHLP